MYRIDMLWNQICHANSLNTTTQEQERDPNRLFNTPTFKIQHTKKKLFVTLKALVGFKWDLCWDTRLRDSTKIVSIRWFEWKTKNISHWLWVIIIMEAYRFVIWSICVDFLKNLLSSDFSCLRTFYHTVFLPKNPFIWQNTIKNVPTNWSNKR